MIAYHRSDIDRKEPVDALQTEGPCNVETDEGPFCADPGAWLVYYPGAKPKVLDQALFDAQFIIPE